VTRQDLERHQVWAYLLAIALGLGLGSVVPAVAGPFEAALWPVLGLLLYATFTQVPLAQLGEALRDRRYMGAVLAGNFIAVPLLVWPLTLLLPDDPAVLLGVLLVLLVPCTDWTITFTHLAGGDTRRAIAATPVNLLVQIVALPPYLLLFTGDAFIEILSAERVVIAFGTLILLPLLAAWATGRWAGAQPRGRAVVHRLGSLPVPLLALVVFLIAASQIRAVAASLPALAEVVAVFVLFLAGAALIGLALGRALSLPGPQVSALIFSLGTRNSFVVLPLALALGEAWAVAGVVIVVQSLVELFGLVAYLRLVPRLVSDGR
jgi:ACR3 family arsenite transporter